jgi:RNA recognition motif-containing protein
MNNKLACKVFVGNIPFQCDQDEFISCFENMKGFISAEIIYKPNSNITRGFGFVSFDTRENAKSLIANNNISFENRILRFSEYMFDNWKEKEKNNKVINTIKLKKQNLLIMKGIDENITREKIYEIFSKYGNVGKHFIASDHETGIYKNYAVIEILDNNIFESLLDQKKIDNYELVRWKY